MNDLKCSNTHRSFFCGDIKPIQERTGCDRSYFCFDSRGLIHGLTGRSSCTPATFHDANGGFYGDIANITFDTGLGFSTMSAS